MIKSEQKQTKQTKAMVTYVNGILKERKINFSNMHDNGMPQNAFNTMCDLLIKAHCYHGFNEYYEKETTVNGKTIKCNCLTGGSQLSQEECPNSMRYIQINVV